MKKMIQDRIIQISNQFSYFKNIQRHFAMMIRIYDNMFAYVQIYLTTGNEQIQLHLMLKNVFF